MEDQEDRTPRKDGTEPVREHPTPPAGAGRSTTQTVIVVLGVLVVLAALVWVALPLLSG